MPLCYKDKTFCYSDCQYSSCHRYIHPETLIQAQKDNLPMALTDFSSHCPAYDPGRKDWEWPETSTEDPVIAVKSGLSLEKATSSDTQETGASNTQNAR